MTLPKFDLKFLIILVLAGIVLTQYCSRKDPILLPGKTEVRVDTIYDHKTTFIHIPGEKIYVDKPIYVKIPTDVDTMEILKDYFAKRIYKDTLILNDKAGKVVLLDTISQNKIFSRTFTADIITKTIVIDSTKYVITPPKNQIYAGFNLGYGGQNTLNITGGLVLKTKRDKMFQAGVGVIGNGTSIIPYGYGGLYWKIKLKK